MQHPFLEQLLTCWFFACRLCSRRNFSSKGNPQSANAVANATEAEAVSASRSAAAATANKVVQRGSNRVYSPTEKFALALWHG